MEKWELPNQVLNLIRAETSYIEKGRGNREEIGWREERIFITYLKTGVWFVDPEPRQQSFSALACVPLIVAMVTVKCRHAGSCVT